MKFGFVLSELSTLISVVIINPVFSISGYADVKFTKIVFCHVHEIQELITCPFDSLRSLKVLVSKLFRSFVRRGLPRAKKRPVQTGLF